MWRSVYTAILRLHPEAFRDRYAEEMLWIFDQEAPRGGAVSLVGDGLLSLIRQRWRRAESPAYRLVAAGAPSFQRLDTRVFGGAPLLIGFVGSLILLVFAFTLIVRHGSFPGVVKISTMYDYREIGPPNLTPDWLTLQALDLDGDGLISHEERMRPEARRWEPLFLKAEADDGVIRVEELRALLLDGAY